MLMTGCADFGADRTSTADPAFDGLARTLHSTPTPRGPIQPSAMISNARRFGAPRAAHPTSRLPLLVCCAASLGALWSCASSAAKDATGTKIEQLDPEGISQALTRIARLEDARTDGDGELMRFVRHGDARVRQRAALALGRLPRERFGAPVTAALASALADESAAVRRLAAFSIGERGDVEAAEALLERWHDPDELVRAAVIEAASRLPVARLREEILFSVGDPSASVRQEVVVAPHRWSAPSGEPAIGPSDEQIDTVLIGVTRKMPLINGREAPLPGVPYTNAHSENEEVIWHALFTLARRKSPRARETFLAHARSKESTLSRLYAVRGLSALAGAEGISPDDIELRGALEHALGDPDWRVVCEALVGLGAHKSATRVEKLAKCFRHDSAHVRRVAFEALGQMPVDPQEALPWIELGLQNRSVSVRAAALVAQAAIFGAEAYGAVQSRRDDPNAVLRIGVCEAAGKIGDEAATALLFELTKDSELAVAGAAITAIGELALPRSEEAEERRRADGVHDALRDLLTLEDNGLRLAAVTALEGSIKAGDISYIQQVFQTTHGDIAPEVRTECLQSVAKIEAPEAGALLELGLSDTRVFVRQTARQLLQSRDASRTFEPERAPTELPELPSSASSASSRPSTEKTPSAQKNPLLEIVTTRGVMVFELFPAEAPLHVYNFLELARRGHYDELSFHRVVPDFVIQGGCYRGDGNGSVTWRPEQALRQEIGMRKYARGSLGMPRNSDPDSGGSQIFVTHRPTPHLDGRYTIFGELREGWEVLDTIEVGDKILAVDLRS